MDLYFECTSGISGDMSVGALLDLGASKDVLDAALLSLNLEKEFKYKITNQMVNSISTTDFEVVISEHKHHHLHRNLNDINMIIDKADISKNAKNLAKKIFKIVAQAESSVHNKDITQIHFHEIGAIDSIVDIVSFAVLYDSLSPKNVYFSTIIEGQGCVSCQHGELPVPVPAVCEIVSKYQIPIKITSNQGEMITPTGAAIVASLYSGKKLPDEIIIDKIGYGHGKRPYKNPVLLIMKIKENACI